MALAALTVGALAQNGTKSPYSQYGIGVLSDPSQGLGRGMNGTGIGVRMGNAVNTLNPASYSGVDSLTMLFDAGLSGQVTNFKEGGHRQNAKTANFDYVVGSFRLLKNVGVSFGVLPMSSVGYSYTSSSLLDQSNGTLTETYSGDGGLRQVFIGAGAKILGPLSVGFNAGYLWGDINRTVASSSTSYVNSLSKTYSATVKSYNLEAGLQWEQPLSRKDVLTIGATVGIGHKLGADPVLSITNSSTGTTSDTITNGLELPMSYGFGLSYLHARKLMVAADMSLQKWGSLAWPDANSSSSNGTAMYTLKDGLLKDRLKLNAGVDWIPNPMSRRYLSLVHYRMGVGYATPYYKIGGKDGPKEFSATVGFGIPIYNSYNNRSVLNISGQWVHSSATGLITENTFRINIGLTFNERWFMKWKVE